MMAFLYDTVITVGILFEKALYLNEYVVYKNVVNLSPLHLIEITQNDVEETFIVDIDFSFGKP